MQVVMPAVITALGIWYLLSNWMNPRVTYTEALRWQLKSERNELFQGEKAENSFGLKSGGDNHAP